MALQNEFTRLCASARLEPFRTRPAAFGRFYQVDALIYLAGSPVVAQPPLAGGIAAQRQRN